MACISKVFNTRYKKRNPGTTFGRTVGIDGSIKDTPKQTADTHTSFGVRNWEEDFQLDFCFSVKMKRAPIRSLCWVLGKVPAFVVYCFIQPLFLCQEGQMENSFLPHAMIAYRMRGGPWMPWGGLQSQLSRRQFGSLTQRNNLQEHSVPRLKSAQPILWRVVNSMPFSNLSQKKPNMLIKY